MSGPTLLPALVVASALLGCTPKPETALPRPLSAYEQGVADSLTVGPPPGALGYPIDPPEDAEAVYGNRAGFFSWTPPTHRADPDWRDALDDRLATAEPVWSQGFEELIVRDFFGSRRGGVFVDVGSYRPMFESTTYHLERNLDWSGLAIDAMPGLAEEWKRHRPRSTFFQHAISNENGEQVTFYVGKLTSALDQDMVDRFGGTREKVQLTARTLDSLLEQQGITKVDFLSIDIEGAEPLALEGFDIERYRPDLCCIEANKRDEIRAYFAAHGYELIDRYTKVDKVNDYFRPTASGPK